MSGQGDAPPAGRRRRILASAAACLLLTLSACAAKGTAEEKPSRETPSGMPVPRFVVLKFNEVNARAGPGDDHRLLWVYHSRGLPVQVVAETAEWRRVCDPDGGLAWIHRRTTDGRPTVMNRASTPVVIYRSREAGAHPVADLNPRSLASLIRCEDGWCHIRADGVSGWAHAAELWGTQQTPQCR